MRCNLCGGTEFSDMPKRPKVRCTACGSLERTRVAGLHIQHKLALQPGARILHFAPERGLSKLLRGIGGENYRCCDINPELYPGLGVERFDLTRDLFDLPRGYFDLILHNHVLEHIEGNYSAVLLRLAAALKPDGTMLFSMPILPGHFSDELIHGTHEEKLAKFGDTLHVRRFGRDFLQETIGMLFSIPAEYDLTRSFPEAVLEEANIPAHHWRTYTGTSIFRVSPADIRV
ncbi:methyltransferase domain-containing protein [Methylovirgula sp. 4M-Z18]|uniref:methyltransferase domain-containing protein n=1 Tax=Methylovirgula sp. 4M-Z18 TaxID=2293567 RepID=UPI000E2EA66E|nr:methyltransferase domain-containing protein [Methylovirgula sp. 4M-Z18]RFB81168.1 methyltransferase domain-containing protein [Methylovirgula sp. 4M-Z18]